MKSTFFLALCLVLSQSVFAQGQTAKTLIDKMFSEIDKHQTLKFNIRTKERIGERYVVKKNFMKIGYSPRKVYLKDLEEGIELLYLDGWNSNRCYINTNGFPYVNVSFSPFSARVRKDQHHTIMEAGFWYIRKTLGYLIKKSKEENMKFDDYFKLYKDATFEGKTYYQLVMEYSNFAYVDYTLTKDESAREIAQRLNLAESLIEEKNGIGQDKISKGKTIKIPNVYAKKVVFYVDKTSFLPVVQFVYDDKGLYEQYEYTDVVANPAFANDEFSENFKDYKFH